MPPVYYTIVAARYGSTSGQAKRCGHCGYVNRMSRKRCNATGCDRPLRKRPVWKPKPKPKRGTVDRMQLDLARVRKLSDLWASKARIAVSKAHQYHVAERRLMDRIAAGPQPTRPPKPKAPIRGIRLTRRAEQMIAPPAPMGFVP